MYKLINYQGWNGVYRLSDSTTIPFDPDNTDYQTFKSDIANGAELQDEDGKKMTATKVKKFLASLP